MATDQIKYDDAVELYIHLHPAFFAYIIFECKSASYIDFGIEMHDGRKFINNKQLADWLKSIEKILNYPFLKKSICINTRSFTFLNDKKLANSKNFKVVNEFIASSETLLLDQYNEDLFVQFSLKKATYKNLLTYVDEQDVYFGDKGIINALLKSQTKSVVFCQILGEEVSIGVRKDNQLVLFNKYTFKNNEDLLYYILLCYQSNELDTNEIPLYLSGLIEQGSPMYKLIFDYIKTVETNKGLESVKLSDSIEGKINHYYFNLLNINI